VNSEDGIFGETILYGELMDAGFCEMLRNEFRAPWGDFSKHPYSRLTDHGHRNPPRSCPFWQLAIPLAYQPKRRINLLADPR
jgi:hypothetical protein